MKNSIIKSSLLLLIFISGITIAGGSKTEKFKVWGNCEMCKKTIEKAAKTKGVEKAVWDVDSKIILVTYNVEKTNLADIQKSIALVGYDNDGEKGNDKAYKKLPHCCQYERK